MRGVLRLEVTEFTDLTRWRWVLTDENGAFLADHDVRLDPESAQFEAFTDLRRYVSWHVAPDKRHSKDEARIVAETGDWVAEHVLGDAIAKILLKRRPATVRVVLPADAEALAFVPLEIARVDGKPLSARDITLVICPGTGEDPMGKDPIGDRLRVLGLFSLPEGGSPLNLRRERQSLVELIHRVTATGRAADIKILQYGVTRERLRDVLQEDEGWDIIHISGHGAPGELMLETAAGSPDTITADDLADVLDTARERLKLVTVAACWSAAITAAEQRRLLHLPLSEPERRWQSPSDNPLLPGAIASRLADRLGCAVLAMRYPVNDEFTIALSGKLYGLLTRQGQPLSRAVATALKHLRDEAPEYPALSMAAPTLFGSPAADLRLRAPDRTAPAVYDLARLKMAGFPPQPDRFVGRTGVMARASSALAMESGIPGVVLYGMPGGGKTACALELAYGHEDGFDRLVWCKAPDEGMDTSGSLTDFALKLEQYLPGFQMIDKITTDAALTACLPRLTELMERSRVLIVIDNAESLFTETGEWRDTRWGQVFSALTGHTGLGRVIMTTRRVPAGTSPDPRVVEAVDALTADEALLLARELPNLRALIQGKIPGIDRATSRKLAVGILTVAQGHPKLLELADGQAGRPEQLNALIESGGQAWRKRGGLPDGFFSTGETAASPGDYLPVLAAWTKTVTTALPPDERDLFWVLCCLEMSDRQRFLLESIQPTLWEELGRGRQSVDLDEALSGIASSGLATIMRDIDGQVLTCVLHPSVAAAGRDNAGNPFQNTVDAIAAERCRIVFRSASGEVGDGTVHTGLLVRAALSGSAYLIRREQWVDAARMLDQAVIADSSRMTAAAVLPAIIRILPHNPDASGVLSRVLPRLSVEAESQIRFLLDEAAARGAHGIASTLCRCLSDICSRAGRLPEALVLSDRAAAYTRQAGLGPWSQLLARVSRLRVQSAMGRDREVFDEVCQLWDRLDGLSAAGGPNEVVPAWAAREALLETGRGTAHRIGLHEVSLDFNAALTASMRGRYTAAAEIARVRLNDSRPLLRLGRTDDALRLLVECRQVFHRASDIKGLAKTLAALADVESSRGHGESAIRLECYALRFEYFTGELIDIAASYHNLGNYLHIYVREPAGALRGHLTAALICALTGLGGTGRESATGAVRSAAVDLRQFGPAAEPPSDVADLCRRIGDIPGTDPAALIARLSPDPETAEQTLRDLIAQARQLAEATPDSSPLKVNPGSTCFCERLPRARRIMRSPPGPRPPSDEGPGGLG